MRLKDKQTGEVGDYTIVNRVGEHCVGVAKDGDIDNPIFFDSIAELNERFDDAPEEKKYGGRAPEVGDKYWVISAYAEIMDATWNDGFFDHSAFECGNAFWTKEEAEKELKRRKAYTILKEDTKGFEPDWGKSNNIIVFFNHFKRILVVDSYTSFQYFPNDLIFANRKDAETSIKVHEKEWKTWLGVKDEK